VACCTDLEGLRPRSYAAAAKPQSVYDQKLMNGTHERVQNIE